MQYGAGEPDVHCRAVGAQLKVKIARQQAAREQKQRRRNLTKYVPNAAAAVFKVLQTMAETPAVRPQPQVSHVLTASLACIAEPPLPGTGWAPGCFKHPPCVTFLPK